MPSAGAERARPGRDPARPAGTAGTAPGGHGRTGAPCSGRPGNRCAPHPVARAAPAVPMLSGRGPGPIGGTLDKLQALPGYQAAHSRDRLLRVPWAGPSRPPPDQRRRFNGGAVVAHRVPPAVCRRRVIAGADDGATGDLQPSSPLTRRTGWPRCTFPSVCERTETSGESPYVRFRVNC